MLLPLALMFAAPALEPAPPPPPRAKVARRTAKAKRPRKARRAAAAPLRIPSVMPEVRSAVAAIDPPNCRLEPLAIGCDTRHDAYYRVPAEVRDYSMKDLAMQETGEKCSLIGQEVCRQPPRKVLRVATEDGSVDLATPGSDPGTAPAAPR